MRYLAAVFLSFLYLAAKGQDLRHFDYRRADSIAAQTVMAKGEKYVDVAHRLADDLPTGQEKFRAIFRWVCAHLEYTEGNYTMDPGQLLRHGKAVCQGYAALLRDMCTEVGLECVMITGYARNAPEDIGKKMKKLERHAWNAVMLGGEWRLCDATWASGTFDKKTKTYSEKFNENYFISTPQFFARTHYPEEKKWQLLDKKVSRRKFLHGPIVWSPYDSLGLTDIAGRKYRLTFTGLFPLRLSYHRPAEGKQDSVTFSLDPKTYYYEPRVRTDASREKTRVRMPVYKRGLYYVTMFVNHKAVATYKVRAWGIDPDKIKARKEKRLKKRKKKTR